MSLYSSNVPSLLKDETEEGVDSDNDFRSYLFVYIEKFYNLNSGRRVSCYSPSLIPLCVYISMKSGGVGRRLKY